MSMPSAKRRCLRYSPSVFKPLYGFPSQSSEFPFECCREQLWRYRISLTILFSWCWSCCFLCVGGLSSSSWCRFPSGVRCTHLLSPVLEARWVLLELALSRKLSRSWRMRCRMGYYILCTSPSVGLRRGCGMSLSIRFWVQLALVAGFRRVSSLAFSLVLSWILYRCLIVDVSVCNSWGLCYFLSWRLS